MTTSISPIDLRIPLTPEVQDQVLFTELSKVYNALRQLQLATTTLTGAIQQDMSVWDQLLPTDTLKGQNLSRLYVKAGEDIPYGATVNFYDLGAGLLGVRKANATSGAIKQCQGFCTTVGGILMNNYGEVILGTGLCTAIAGLTIGSTYYQSTTPGIITAAKPAAPNLQQPIGFAIGPSYLFFNAPAI